MATLSYSPTAPVKGEVVTLSLSAASPYEIGRYELTSVPDLSALETGMLLDANDDPIDTFTPDVAGAYGVKAYVYRSFSGAGAYAGDPAGEAREELVSTATGTVYAGSAMALPIAGAGHRADLRLVLVGATITGASLVNPTTEAARLAGLDATVATALAALVGQDIGLAGEDLFTGVRALQQKYDSHRKTGSWHVANDTVNAVTDRRIDSEVGAIEALNAFYDIVLAHMINNGNTGSHLNADRHSMPIAAKAHDRATATVLLADLRRRVYARHIVMVGTGADQIHQNSGDASNGPSADTPIAAAIVAVLDYYAAQTPTTPTGESPGVAGAIEYGFAPTS